MNIFVNYAIKKFNLCNIQPPLMILTIAAPLGLAGVKTSIVSATPSCFV
jgi:hypothetical protein